MKKVSLFAVGFVLVGIPVFAADHRDCDEYCYASAACREPIEREHDFAGGQCTNYGYGEGHGAPVIIADGGSSCRLETGGLNSKEIAFQLCSPISGKLECNAKGSIRCWATTGPKAGTWVNNPYGHPGDSASGYCGTNIQGYPPQQSIRPASYDCYHANDLKVKTTSCNTDGGLSTVWWP